MHEAEALATAIGARVKRERQLRGWTLDQLAQASGVSRRMVVNVEQGAANPSVSTLLGLADALGVGLPVLVAPPEPPGAVRVTRGGQGATLWSSEGDGRAVLVAASAVPEAVELWDWTLGAGDRHASAAHGPGTTELLLVQQGSVTLEVGEEASVLEAGDAATFRGDVEHAYANPAAEPARFVLAVVEPAGGAGRRSRRGA